MNEAADALAPLRVTVTALDAVQATAVLTSCANPESLVSAAADVAPRAAIIITAAGFADTDADADPDSFPSDPFAPEGGAGFAPEPLTIGTRHLEIGSDWAATVAVTGCAAVARNTSSATTARVAIHTEYRTAVPTR
ncbi:hypothetical protein [Nocardia anaemiae]|uniref:hypothetical protein n=1 Tax=Nocardia anaemiae TaxID=263910 RepID=UPI0007A4BA90|nr:hypothetical protein [Nocardia anaemiae]